MSSATEPNQIKSISGKFYNIPEGSNLTDISPTGESVEFPEIISFNYFESIHESFLRARITILDSAGEVDKAFNKCGIRQFCPVEIEIHDPAGGSDWERPVTTMTFAGSNCFYVNRVISQNVKGKKKSYTLELINKDAIVAFNTTVKFALPPDKTTKVDYNSAIDLVMGKYIKTVKPADISTEMTEPVAKIMGNGKKTYQLINHICAKATPKSTTTGSGKEETRATGYVFYETYDKYRFNSIYNLMTKASNYNQSHGAYTVRINNTVTATGKDAAYTILSFNFYDSGTQSGLLEEIASGKRGKKQHLVLDVARNKFKRIDKLPSESSVDPCLKAASDGQLTDIIVTDQAEYQTEFYRVCDPNALENEPTAPELTSLNYPATLALLKQKRASMRIPGNLSLCVGDHVYLEFPEIKADSGKEPEISPKYSGYYLITQLNHKVEEIQHVYTHLELCKLVNS